ncbi:MAG: hypothetical protein ACKO1I_21435, partial [Microcystis aeruginosa]
MITSPSGFIIKKLIFLKNIRTEWFRKDLRDLLRQKGDDNTFVMGKLFPVLSDRSDEGGILSGHYFH